MGLTVNSDLSDLEHIKCPFCNSVNIKFIEQIRKNKTYFNRYKCFDCRKITELHYEKDQFCALCGYNHLMGDPRFYP